MYRACLSVDMHSFVDLPNEEERMNILHIYLDLHPTKDIDYSLISQSICLYSSWWCRLELEYYSGADIASLCRYCTLDMIDQHKVCIRMWIWWDRTVLQQTWCCRVSREFLLPPIWRNMKNWKIGPFSCLFL